MNLRPAIIAGTAAASLAAGCTSSAEQGTPQTTPVFRTGFSFLSNPHDSDVIMAINCRQPTLDNRAGNNITADIPMPTAPNASVTVTLGVTDEKLRPFHDTPSHNLLGGVSIRATQNHDDVAYSDSGSAGFDGKNPLPGTRTLDIAGQPVAIGFRLSSISGTQEKSLLATLTCLSAPSQTIV